MDVLVQVLRRYGCGQSCDRPRHDIVTTSLPFRSEPLYAAPVVQPDMVLVPREPTEAMLDAAMNRYGHVSPEAKARNTQMHRENFRCDYKAMIAAAEGKSNAELTGDPLAGASAWNVTRLDGKEIDARQRTDRLPATCFQALIDGNSPYAFLPVSVGAVPDGREKMAAENVP